MKRPGLKNVFEKVLFLTFFWFRARATTVQGNEWTYKTPKFELIFCTCPYLTGVVGDCERHPGCGAQAQLLLSSLVTAYKLEHGQLIHN